MNKQYLLEKYIELATCRLSLATFYKEINQAILENRFEKAAEYRDQCRLLKRNIEQLCEESWIFFKEQLTEEQRQEQRSNLYRIVDESALVINATAKPNANNAFKEHFAHDFAQLTERYEQLLAEEKYADAKVVLEMSLMVGEWLGRGTLEN